MTREEVQAFLQRDWDLSRHTKDSAVGAWVRTHGTTAAFRLAQVLFDQAWPLVRKEQAGNHDVSGLLRYSTRLARARSRDQ